MNTDPKSIPEGRALIDEYKNTGLSTDEATKYAKSLIESGSSLPVKSNLLGQLIRLQLIRLQLIRPPIITWLYIHH